METTYTLSKQAIVCVMMAFQNGLIEGKDITKIIQGFDFILNDDGFLDVSNPPDAPKFEEVEEAGINE
jgi:hypothetical protein